MKKQSDLGQSPAATNLLEGVNLERFAHPLRNR
jgi:hypothetical protein